MTTQMELSTRVAKRLQTIHQRIAAACERTGQDEADVTLIAVSKTHPAETVRAGFEAGMIDFGENRVAEGADKITALKSLRPRPTWHLIGHLQSNKAGKAIDCFDTIHSVDSAKLMHRLGRLATRELGVFIQVNVSGEASKEGIQPSALPELVAAAAEYPQLRLEGLMTIAPLSADPEAARPHFANLRKLAQQHGLRHLSMGMTNDYEVAIEEGATHVRVGRAIFGERAN